jgi:prepilin-type N-terminal cleavage/methylation domain-containing protein
MYLSSCRRQKTTSGFSLVEMIVAISVFLVAILIISGALLRLVDASRKAHGVRGAMDNVGTALEGMSRTMRFGTVYHCGCETSAAAYAASKSCPLTNLTTGAGGADCLAFEGPNGDLSDDSDQIVYRFQLISGKGQIQRSGDSGTTWSVVTAPETIITALKFYVNGTDADNDQPSANIVVRGYVQESPETRTTFDVQTIVTQRAPNFADGSFYGGPITLPPPPPPPPPPPIEICNDNIDNDGNSLVDCKDYDGCGTYGLVGDSADVSNVKTDPSKPIPPYGCQEIRGPLNNTFGISGWSGPKDPANGCSDSVDNNAVYAADCRDSYYCRYQISGKCQETCNNGVDDNGNGLIDCVEWAACGSYPACAGSTPPPPPPPPAPSPSPVSVCGDGICSSGETSKSCQGDCKGSGNEN